MMRLRALRSRLRASLWFLPSLFAVGAAVLAFLTVRLDQRVVAGAGSALEMPWFVFGAGAEGARGVLSTIAGSIITVTGVVFSITVVVLQLASSQFTPRVLRSFTEDRANQLVLAVFIGTFTYALLVLRTVRSAADDYARFVPSISITIALALALISIGFLIFYVGHIARSIQAEVILDRVTRDALDVVERIFPESLVLADGDDAQESDPELPAQQPAAVVSKKGGYLQTIDMDAILRLAESGDLTVRLEKEIGAFVVPGEALASVWPAGAAAHLLEELRRGFHLGLERTREQDIERGLIELTDIGVRALSPGVNDPTTAIVCVDRLSQVMAALGSRRFPARLRAGRDGSVRVIAPRTTFEQAVLLGFAQLRHHGARDPAVAIRLIDALARVAARVTPARRALLLREIDEVVESARREVGSASDLARIEDTAATAVRRVAPAPTSPG